MHGDTNKITYCQYKADFWMFNKAEHTWITRTNKAWMFYDPFVGWEGSGCHINTNKTIIKL